MRPPKGTAALAEGSFGRARGIHFPFVRGRLFVVANDPETDPVGEDPAIDSLEQRIAKARADESKRTEESRLLGQVNSSAMSVASTMVGYPLGGIIIGYFLDRVVFGTLPWLTIIFMFLAFVGACIHVVRMNSNKGGSAE